MQRGFKQTLEQRLSDEAKRLLEQAELLPHGAFREQVLREAWLAENGSQMVEWLRPRGSQPPK
jgi:hypothetical protein